MAYTFELSKPLADYGLHAAGLVRNANVRPYRPRQADTEHAPPKNLGTDPG